MVRQVSFIREVSGSISGRSYSFLPLTRRPAGPSRAAAVQACKQAQAESAGLAERAGLAAQAERADVAEQRRVAGIRGGAAT